MRDLPRFAGPAGITGLLCLLLFIAFRHSDWEWLGVAIAASPILCIFAIVVGLSGLRTEHTFSAVLGLTFGIPGIVVSVAMLGPFACMLIKAG